MQNEPVRSLAVQRTMNYMKNLKVFTLTLIAFCFISKALAQTGSITGKLLDDKGAPVAFANVTLLKAADTAFVAGTLIAKEGTFSISSP